MNPKGIWRMCAACAGLAALSCALAGCDFASEAGVPAAGQRGIEAGESSAARQQQAAATTTPADGTPIEDVAFPEYTVPVTGAVDMRGKVVPQLVIEKWVADEAPELQGKVVMIEFWATWCPPCRRAIPHLNELTDRYGDDLQIISVTAEDIEIVKGFLGVQAMKSAVAIDSRSRLANALRIQGIPHAIICSSDGVVRWQGNPLALQDEEVQQIVRANRALVRRQAG